MIKWIGQHIWDFVSRFRNDIYIVHDDGDEYKISTSTQDLDVNVPSGSGTGVRFFNTSQDDPVFDFNVGRAQLNIKDDTGGGNPSMSLTTGANIASGTTLNFTKGRISGGSVVAGQDDDIINTIGYKSYNDAAEPITFAQVQAQIADASDTDEVGKYTIQVATSNGTTSNLRNVLYAEGSPSADDVDVTIGHGSTSVVTFPGRISPARIDLGGTGVIDILNSSESFSDTDTALMTAAAIDDRIAAAGGSVSVSDSTANTDFPVVFHDESNNLHDDTGAFTYNPFTGLLTSGKGDITSLVTDTLKVDTAINLGHATDTTIARSAAGKVTIEGNQIVTAGAVSVASEAQAPISTMVARRTITQAEANNMHSTPIEIVPAQGANTVIIPLGGMVRVDRATTQSQGACDWNMHYADQEPGTYLTSSIQHIRRFMYNESGDRIFHITPGIAATEVAQSLTDDNNKAVEVSFDSAATTNAFTGIDVYLTYYVIQIS